MTKAMSKGKCDLDPRNANGRARPMKRNIKQL